MRSLNFRDFVLWPIAQHMGLNPSKRLLEDDAQAIVVYINGWVRRLYTALDWPEWSTVQVSVPVDHIVPYEFTASNTGLEVKIGKVLSVYLVDPRTTNASVDTPFDELAEGIHVGFDHGETVWIKYLPLAPVFTGIVWNGSRTYALGNSAYSPVSGECYASKINGNIGNDPSSGSTDQALTTEITQNAVPPQPGVDGQDKIMIVNLFLQDGTPIANPPPAGSIFIINVKTSAGVTIATANHVATGVQSLVTILTDLLAQLVADVDLASFTLTQDNPTLSITLEDASDFGITAFYKVGMVTQNLKRRQTQAFIPPVPPTEGLPQIATISLTNSQIKSGGEYFITLVDQSSVPHTISYVATPNDNATTVLNGLAAAINEAGASDPVFALTGVTVDQSTNIMTLTNAEEVGLNAYVRFAGSAFWDVIPFPLDLVEAVVRGASGDVLKEWGQTDKGAAEEQAVPSETGTRTTVAQGQNWSDLTDRPTVKSRYMAR
jgi:hypothetical protein